MKPTLDPKIKTIVEDGGVIAYPTEAVFGLGCDPLNEEAVKKILTMKQRDVAKGLILIASEWKQLEGYIKKPSAKRMAEIKKTWPGPHTWIFPASSKAPKWITGDHSSIAIRITAHSIAAAICDLCQSAIVSTSANRGSEPPIKDPKTLANEFANEVDYIVPGNVGDQKNPTEIRDSLSGDILRPS